MIVRKRKYGNIKMMVDNIKFDSQAEATRYAELKLLLKIGKIKDLVLQPVFILQDNFKHDGKTERAIKYIADFQYIDCETDRCIVEDVKGMETKDFLIKKKLFLYKYGERYVFRLISTKQ